MRKANHLPFFVEYDRDVTPSCMKWGCFNILPLQQFGSVWFGADRSRFAQLGSGIFDGRHSRLHGINISHIKFGSSRYASRKRKCR